MESLRGDPNLVEGLLSGRSSGNALLANSVDDNVRRDVPPTAVLGDFGWGARRAMPELEKEAARSKTPHAATNVRSAQRLLSGIIVSSSRSIFMRNCYPITRLRRKSSCRGGSVEVEMPM